MGRIRLPFAATLVEFRESRVGQDTSATHSEILDFGEQLDADVDDTDGDQHLEVFQDTVGNILFGNVLIRNVLSIEALDDRADVGAAANGVASSVRPNMIASTIRSCLGNKSIIRIDVMTVTPI